MNPRAAEASLAELEGHARRGGRPSHHLARQVLLALGPLVREEGAASAPWVARARTAGGSAGAGWDEAVRDELTLAVGEFAQCVDPRYLDLPGYDMEYTLAARARLEDRLHAARALGYGPSPREAEVLELADRVLASARERTRSKLEGLQQPAQEPPTKAARSRRNGRRK